MPNVETPDQILSALLNASSTGNHRQLADLCAKHQTAILAAFPSWQKIPENIRANQAAVKHYVETLITVATFFAENLRNPQLIQRLTGPQESNPLAEWQQGLQQARHLMNDLRYNEANRLLGQLLDKVRGLQGTGADEYLPITYGFLGESYLQQGEAAKALEPYKTALKLCQDVGDQEGMLAYWLNLYETYRYLGDGDSAATAAERASEIFEKQGEHHEAARYKKRANIARVGEPLNRVVINTGSEYFELSELAQITAKHVQFVFERNRITLRHAGQLTALGEQLGSKNQFGEALRSFQQGAKADSFDPNCHYLAGLTLVHLHRYAEAIDEYQTTERLAPGWFHCRYDLWLAQQLAEGRIDHETFLILYQLEDSPLPAKDKVRLAEKELQRKPELAALYFFLGENLSALGQQEAAETAYRNALECVKEPDLQTRLLLNLGTILRDKDEQIDLFQQAQKLNGNLVAAAMAAFTLSATSRN